MRASRRSSRTTQSYDTNGRASIISAYNTDRQRAVTCHHTCAPNTKRPSWTASFTLTAIGPAFSSESHLSSVGRGIRKKWSRIRRGENMERENSGKQVSGGKTGERTHRSCTKYSVSNHAPVRHINAREGRRAEQGDLFFRAVNRQWPDCNTSLFAFGHVMSS